MKSGQLTNDLLKKGENEQLDFKETVRKADIAKTICGFLNLEGGQILLGIKDSKEAKGIQNAERVKQELENYLAFAIVPNAPVSISVESYKKAKLILVKVWKGSRFPYTFDSSIYYRIKAQTVKASPNQISNLILKRQQSETLWERQSALGVELYNLDLEMIKKTILEIERTSRGKVFKADDIEGFLTHYGLYQNGNLTNAAVVLFAKEPSRFLPQSRVRLTIFNSDKAGQNFSYDKYFEDSLFKNVENITDFFEVNIGISIIFNEKKWTRTDKGFPRLALREGLLNAIIHRDYSNVSGTVHIAFYPDRLEIINNGELPYSAAELKKNHLSQPRNPDIAHICFLREWIEKIGRGTIKMIEDCEDKGYPEPKWTSKSGITTVIFPEITVTAKTDTVSDTESDTITGLVNDTVSDTVTDTVKERLVKTILAIIEKPGLKKKELVDLVNVSEVTVKRDMQKINELVMFEGSQKTGGYFVKDGIKRKLKKKQG